MDSAVEARYLTGGFLLRQRYRIDKVIGAGGFGVTYAVWDMILEQKVAIKEYFPGEFSTRGAGQTNITIYGGEKTEQFYRGKQKFFEESKKLAEFRNVPGIVQIFDCFDENGTIYIVMEYLEGETLETKLKREHRISEREAVEIMVPILQALEIVHQNQILHRDVAPNNIFITSDGKVKLLDFGAARSVTGGYSKSLTVLYKEGYTPEEQYRSRGDQGPWTDVYACAATMYRMLTGVIPQGALERRAKDKLVKPSRKRIRTSKNVEHAIMNALNVDVKYRTQSAGIFMEELIGKRRSKLHFFRTVERKMGRVPLSVKIITSATILATLIFCGLLFLNVIHFDMSKFGQFLLPSGKSRVPNIVNQDIDYATEVVEDQKLKIEIDHKEYSYKTPKNKILTQSTAPGEIIDQGDTISVVVSGGAKLKENGYQLEKDEAFVPDIVNMYWKDAEKLIKENELEVKMSYDMDENYEVGTVMKQIQNAGTVVKEGDVLYITVNIAQLNEDEEGFISQCMLEDYEDVINQYREEAEMAPLVYNKSLQKETDSNTQMLSYHWNESYTLTRACENLGNGRFLNANDYISTIKEYNWDDELLNADVHSFAMACYYNPKAYCKYTYVIMFD